MTSTPPRKRPVRRLPARVYWFRRLLVLGVACALVFGVARLLGEGEAAAGDLSARPASAGRSLAPSALPSAGQTGAPTATVTRRKPAAPPPKPTKTPLAMPTGPCPDSDVKVLPALDKAVAGGDVLLTLQLRTVDSPACTWVVSAETVVVKLTSGSDRIWSSQDCPTAVPTKQVVLRKNAVTSVAVAWSGRRSDRECSRTTTWAEPGYYHATAAALGSEPEQRKFALVAPTPPTITPSPTPDPKAKRARPKSNAGQPQAAQPRP